jgi:amino acid transporter
MAGDHALPLSNFFAKVNQSVHTPLNALLFIITAELTIGMYLFFDWPSASNIDYHQVLYFSGVIMLFKSLSAWEESPFSSVI